MITIHGGRIEISGSHHLLQTELACAIAAVREYLIREEAEAYALSTVSVARSKADRKKLEELKKEAQTAMEKEYEKSR